ncbi:hypothetical protein OX284_003270 [Flavobacterium sp. SUN046]|uniref:hypothetical protein n=1 Tax=Flavobacterium sp. SUN046 TaxID=3002440 RepID=UPI002DBA89B8|nr:hypothetical protein [Flavobacterium sp. SUN046]MEC4048438.1 hypothetical protein [Flavobacterium sp. SUN046]
MQAPFTYYLEPLLADFFLSFGLYTLVFLMVSLFYKNPLLIKIDFEASRMISVIGVVYLFIWFCNIFFELAEGSEEEKAFLMQRMFGHYWIGFWLQPLLYFTITQILRVDRIRNQKIVRLVFSLFFILSIERMVILSTSLESDYLPSSWSMQNDSIYPHNFFLNISLKLLVFFLCIVVYCQSKKAIIKHVKKSKRYRSFQRAN